MTTLRVAVVSDLHAYVEPVVGRPAPSHLHTGLPREDIGRHPISNLVELIRREELQADVLLSCGDLGDQANRAAIIYAWDEVQRLAEALGDPVVIATAGNHDLDSRHGTSEPNLRAVLQGLTPAFPTHDPQENMRYWAYHYAILDDSAYRIVSVNSCADHDNPAEIEHGRIERRTTDRLMEALRPGEIRPVQIAICHHHPHRFGDIDLEDYSELRGGQYLLHALGSGELGAWTVVHGHKHLPHLAYAAGGGDSVVILSAGSLTSSLYLDLQTQARNQFYVVEFDSDAALNLEIGLAGSFRSYDWSVGPGWQPAQPGSGLPATGGFGYRANPSIVASRIRQRLALSQPTPQSFDQLAGQLPELRYLIPDDLRSVIRELVLAGVTVSGGDERFEEAALV